MVSSTLLMSASRSPRGAFDRERQLHLALGVPALDVGRRQLRHGCDAAALGQPDVLVDVGDGCGAVRRCAQDAQPVLAQVRTVGVAAATIDERAHPDPAAAGLAEVLDRSLVDAHRQAHRLLRPGVHLVRTGGNRGLHRELRSALEIRRPAVAGGVARHPCRRPSARRCARSAGRCRPGPSGRPCRRSRS